MTPEEFRESIPLYSVGALDGRELEEFESYLADASEEELQELASVNDVAAFLIVAQPDPRPPPPEVKASVLRKINQIETANELPPSAEAVLETAMAKGISFIMEEQGEWLELPTKGARIKELSVAPSRGYNLLVVELDPDTDYPQHDHAGPEEGFLLSGDLHMEDRVVKPGDYFHAEPGSKHGRTYSEHGCRLLLVSSTADYHPKSLRFFNRILSLINKVREAIGLFLRRPRS